MTKLSAVNQYKAMDFFQQGDNIKIIGAESVRGLFDSQHQRLTGKGVTVGVINTGIDHQHADLKEKL